MLGVRLTAEDLEEASIILARTPAQEIVDLYGIDPDRVGTLAAGAVILGAICERLGVALRVVRAACARAPRASSPAHSQLLREPS